MVGVLEQMAESLARIEARLAGGRMSDSVIPDVDQRDSPLGPRKHCEAVRRRVAEGDPSAAIVKNTRKHLLTPQALADELRRASLDGVTPPEEPLPVPGDAYQRAMQKARKVGSKK